MDISFSLEHFFISVAIFTQVRSGPLRHGKNININDIFNKWAAETDNKLVIGNLFDYQKLNLDEKILLLLVQFNNRLFICSGIEFYTCINELRGLTNSMFKKCQNMGRVDLMSQQLTQLRKDFKNFSLVSFDWWRADFHTTTTWQKNDVKHNKYYQWPEYWLGGFVDTKPSSYAKWLIPKNKASIIQEDIKTDLTNLGEIQQAEKELDKNVLEIKALVKK